MYNVRMLFTFYLHWGRTRGYSRLRISQPTLQGIVVQLLLFSKHMIIWKAETKTLFKAKNRSNIYHYRQHIDKLYLILRKCYILIWYMCFSNLHLLPSIYLAHASYISDVYPLRLWLLRREVVSSCHHSTTTWLTGKLKEKYYSKIRILIQHHLRLHWQHIG